MKAQSLKQTTEASINPLSVCQSAPKADPTNSVVVGLLSDLKDGRVPLVTFPNNPTNKVTAAKTTVLLTDKDIGHEVALLFVEGDRSQPLIIGRIQHADVDTPSSAKNQSITADVDGERVVFKAEKEIVLRCGEASITLTRAGKIIVRGTYLVSRSTGINRIKGGSVQIN